MTDTKSDTAPQQPQHGWAKGQAKAEALKAGTDAIGEALKTYFDDLASEPVPDRFIDLLASLENK